MRKLREICGAVKFAFVMQSKREQRLLRLIHNTELRLQRAIDEASKIRAELVELRERLAVAQSEAAQIPLPFENKVRGMSEKWASVLNFIVLRSPQPVSVDDILAFAHENGLEVSRSSVRAQLHHYVQRGFIERIGDGAYLITHEGRRYCDY
ncbi:MAG: hypothetical protein GC150_00385 [Rhizobiales bacterium]|nr:hypothetical protein [Hyphomicrobiales bacterium]